MDVAYECPRRPRSRSRGCTWRSYGSPPYSLSSFTEPRVIFINTTPQADMMCQGCCCACHRSHCMYVGAEGYPLVNEMAHLSRGSFSKSSANKRGNKRISFNPDPEMCYDEGARYETVRLDSMHISEGPSADLTKELAQ